MSEIMPAEDSADRGQSRDGHGRFTRDLDTATKDTLAARLRALGTPLKVIAAKLGYANESGASKAIARALAAVPVADVNELRALEAERLDLLTERLWELFHTKVPLEVGGRLIVDQNDKTIGDPGPALAVADRLLRVSEQRRRLLGLDVPPPRPAPEPKPAALELTNRQAELLQWLLEALQLAPADLPAPLALPTAAEKAGEAL